MNHAANQDLSADLQKIANDNNVVVMSFVAPDSIVKKGPVSYDYAKITIQDLYLVEAAIQKLQVEGDMPPKLHLVIQTPGGQLDASVKIAKYLQAVFQEIEVYVPYEAASGGTILCLAAKTIVMDITSNLTPIDPQVIYDGERIAASSYDQAIEDFEKKFPNQRPDELPSPYRVMSEKFDPIIRKQMNKVVWDTMTVALDLLTKSQNPKNVTERQRLNKVILTLGISDNPHSHIISMEEAESIGLNVSKDSDKIGLLKTYKQWVSSMLNKPETTHIIETFCPIKKVEKTKKDNSKEGGRKDEQR